ncbi:hypothetical protein RRG08_013439 [Elysia crispata]|uniref:Uncharacterized protein n=1 Tax=Elysia crispata TaxID=231223 RepID=A0AAE0ZPN4_9GAST|nr:hypothetical protein RRG08_013439 [Elysia crispata]
MSKRKNLTLKSGDPKPLSMIAFRLQYSRNRKCSEQEKTVDGVKKNRRPINKSLIGAALPSPRETLYAKRQNLDFNWQDKPLWKTTGEPTCQSFEWKAFRPNIICLNSVASGHYLASLLFNTLSLHDEPNSWSRTHLMANILKPHTDRLDLYSRRSAAGSCSDSYNDSFSRIAFSWVFIYMTPYPETCPFATYGRTYFHRRLVIYLWTSTFSPPETCLGKQGLLPTGCANSNITKVASMQCLSCGNAVIMHRSHG